MAFFSIPGLSEISTKKTAVILGKGASVHLAEAHKAGESIRLVWKGYRKARPRIPSSRKCRLTAVEALAFSAAMLLAHPRTT